MSAALPLEGVLALDASRMLPGALLARTLVDLGARVVKVEDPAGGEPMRHTPPLVAPSLSVAFCAFFRGTESVALDLRSPAGAEALRRMSLHADVVIESFRPGTLERWGIGLDSLRARNAQLVTCSLPGFGGKGDDRALPVHDLNLMALSGGLDALRPAGGVPRVQLADLTSGLLAATSILAALLLRARTGRGTHVEQPLASGPLPFLTLELAEVSAGGSGLVETLLSGGLPCYRVYTTSDDREITVGCLEPKFWEELVRLLGLPELAGDGHDRGERGAAAARRVAAAFAQRPLATWLALAREKGLPLAGVNTLAQALQAPYFTREGWIAPVPGAPGVSTAAHHLASSVARAPVGPAPELGRDTQRILLELGAA